MARTAASIAERSTDPSGPPSVLTQRRTTSASGKAIAGSIWNDKEPFARQRATSSSRPGSMNGLARLKQGHARLIDVHDRNVVTERGEARTTDGPDMTRTDDG